MAFQREGVKGRSMVEVVQNLRVCRRRAGNILIMANTIIRMLNIEPQSPIVIHDNPYLKLRESVKICLNSSLNK